MSTAEKTPNTPAPIEVKGSFLDLPNEIGDKADLFDQASMSPRTRRAYQSSWQLFLGWCDDHRADPREPEIVVGFLSDQADSKKLATIEVYLAAISQARGLLGLPKLSEFPRVRRVMRGIRRTLGPQGQTRKTPITVAQLRRISMVIPETPKGIRDRCILLVGFAGAFRRSELVALDVSDLGFTDDGLVIQIRRSKTDQVGDGRSVGIPYGSTPATCPVRAARAWLVNSGITSGPVFRGVDRHGNIGETRLGTRAVSRMIKAAVETIGLDAEGFAGHSLRAGFATEAAKHGVGELAIMRQTGHRSVVTLKKYIRHGQLFVGNAAAEVGL
jgi:integrase